MEQLGSRARIAIALGLATGICMLDLALPAQHLAYALVVPLILCTRAFGMRVGIVLAAVSAFSSKALELGTSHVPVDFTNMLDMTVRCAVWVTAVFVVERYEGVLLRSYRTQSERLASEAERKLRALERDLPAAVRAQEAVAREREFAAIAEAIPQLVWRARGDGVAEYFNEAWIAYTGFGPVQLRDSGIEVAIHASDLEHSRERWIEAMASGTPFECEYRLRRHDGTFRWFLARAMPLCGHDGEVDRWFGTCTDIEDQKRALAQLERRFEVAHHVSETFQTASLPTALPVVPEIAFSATYRAGQREASIGGDWYDALRLIDGRIVISIGDVLGSGLAAAITMIAMRQAMRGAAQILADPVAILEAADRTLREERPDGIVTAFVGVYDPVTHAFVYAGAGHPPPLLRRAGGDIVELLAPGLPLGVRRKGDTEPREIAIEPGDFLTLYTDGLIEATRDWSVGETRLRDAIAALDLARGARAAERLATAILRGAASDDVAIMTLAFAPRPAAAAGTHDDVPEHRWTFNAGDGVAARATQRAVCASLVGLGASDQQVCEAELVFAELVGNVVRHAPGPCLVALDVAGESPVLSVLDRGPGFAVSPRLPIDALAESGRGLFIVRSLAFEFSASLRPGGGTHARAVLSAQTRPAVKSAPPKLLAAAV
jgi:PAS domain S-box-containing protein